MANRFKLVPLLLAGQHTSDATDAFLAPNCALASPSLVKPNAHDLFVTMGLRWFHSHSM
jgi:hypothetical protein